MPAFQTAIFTKTLLCYLQALENKLVIVELRNESVVRGKLIDVDSFMNLQLVDADYSQWGKDESRHFENLYIKGKNIRYVRTDEHLNVMQILANQIKSYKAIRSYDERKKISCKR